MWRPLWCFWRRQALTRGAHAVAMAALDLLNAVLIASVRRSGAY